MREGKTRLIAHVLCAALAMAGTVAAHAQEASESSLDVTIRLLPENAVGPEEITRRIELPPAAADGRRRGQSRRRGAACRENASRGQETQRSARARPRVGRDRRSASAGGPARMSVRRQVGPTTPVGPTTGLGTGERPVGPTTPVGRGHRTAETPVARRLRTTPAARRPAARRHRGRPDGRGPPGRSRRRSDAGRPGDTGRPTTRGPPGDRSAGDEAARRCGRPAPPRGLPRPARPA